jgi:outer membrane protein insertion porin family
MSQKYTPILFYLLFLIFVLNSSCTTSKYIPEGEKLFKKAEIKIAGPINKKTKKELKDELESVIRPKPNKSFLGIRFKLWAHYRGSKPKTTKLDRYLKKKFGQAPALMSQVNAENTVVLMNNRLENNGFFESIIEASSTETKVTGSWKYEIEVQEPYTLNTYSFLEDSTDVSNIIKGGMRRTRIKTGMRYQLERFKEERERIDSLLKRQGYYYFQDDYLIFRVDTNQHETKEFDLYLSLKSNIPRASLIPYKIGEVTVYSDYNSNVTSDADKDTVIYEGMTFIQSPNSIKPKHLIKLIHFREGELYSQRKHSLSSTRLSSINNYRYVNLRFNPEIIDTSTMPEFGTLMANVFLAPLKKRSIRAELQTLSKSNNFVGPVLQLNYRNRNLFKGGETIQLTGKLGFETQIASGRQTGLNSYETGISASVLFPRFLAPFIVPLNQAYALPTTRVSIGYSSIHRVQYFRFNSILASYGYTWSTSRRMSHEINPISINFVKLSNTSVAFDSILNSNPILKRSFAQQFILGLTYSVQYNELMNRRKRNRIFAILSADFSGNVIGGIQNMINGPQPEKRLLGQLYAQYGKADLDIRHYTSIGKQSLWIMRVFGGFGLPYGNSVSLPFAKQYFSAGPNSVRAFRIRSLGPGTYRPEVLDVASYFDQAGDIKFEANVEYRFPIAGIFKGALFADAGNIWLLRENASLPGSKFTGSWAQELAVGTGFGVRLDIGFFILRVDVSTPLRKPFLPKGERWVTNFDFGDKAWRLENIIYMLAIGYPF